MTGKNFLSLDSLKVKGRGLSPNRLNDDDENRSVRSALSSARSMSLDEEDASSEEYTVLDGVKEMNHILVRQIETLRLKIKVDEKNYENDKVQIMETKDSELLEKDDEIEDLRESLASRDDRIHNLSRAGMEKDKTIRSKTAEIDELKKIVKQTEDYATKLQKQVGRVRSERDRLESDTLYQKQNEEMKQLTEELGLLRDRLGTMETELQRATAVIKQQNEKMKTMDAERVEMQVRFREDLEKASKAMRQEVERMREVMRQNFEEMRNLREQNKEMASDVRAIKDMLRRSRADGHFASISSPDVHHIDVGTGLPRPLSENPSPSYARQSHGQASYVTPKSPGGMVGGKILHRPYEEQNAHHSMQPLVGESSQFSASKNTNMGNNFRISGHGQPDARSLSRMSPDTTARTLPKGQTPRRTLNAQGRSSRIDLNVPTSNRNVSGTTQKNLPPICSIKEGAAPRPSQSSGRVGKGTVRIGNAMVKK